MRTARINQQQKNFRGYAAVNSLSVLTFSSKGFRHVPVILGEQTDYEHVLQHRGIGFE